VVRPFAFLHRGHPLRDRTILIEAFMSACLGLAAGAALFASLASLVGVFLVAFSMAPVVETLLERNRQEIWAPESDATAANWRMARSLAAIFAGVLLAYGAAAGLLPPEVFSSSFDFQLGAADAGAEGGAAAGFATLAKRDLWAVAVAFGCAMLYRHGGMLLVLAWAASRWGVVLAFELRGEGAGPEAEGLLAILPPVLVALPHLVLEALATILAAMAGVFLSLGVVRYELRSARLWRVLRAVLVILAVAFMTAAFAALLEAGLSPWRVG
jgi:hypothetical protein